MAVNQRKTGAILTYVQLFLSNTISLLYTPLALNMLGQSQYGLFGTASSLTNYLSLLGFGVGGAYIRWNMKYRAKNDIEGERRLNGMFFALFSFFAALVIIAGFCMVFLSPYIFDKSFSDSELYDLQLIILMNVLNTAMVFFFNPIMACIQAYEKFLIYRIVAIVNIFLSPVINIVILFWGGKAVSLSVASLVLATINFCVYYIYARKRLNMRFIFKGFKLKEFKEIMFFSSFILLNSLTDMITNSTDSVLIGAIIGASAVAVYSIGRNFQNYFLNFSSAVSGVFAPQVNHLVALGKDDSVLDELFIRVARVQFYIVTLILIGYIFVGDSFILLWAGEDYADSYWIGLFLLLGSYIPLFQNVGLEIQKAKNKHQFRSIVYFLIAIGNILLTIPFIYIWGGIGAAFATFLCCVLGQGLIMNIYYHKKIGLDMIKFWKGIFSIFPGLILPIVFCVLIEFFLPINNLSMLVIDILLIVIVYVSSVWTFSMNNYERNLFSTPIKKIFRIKEKVN